MTRANALEPDLKLTAVARLLGFKSERGPCLRLSEFFARGMPAPDKITGRIDPGAFERWRRLRAPHLFPELSAPVTALDPRPHWAVLEASNRPTC